MICTNVPCYFFWYDPLTKTMKCPIIDSNTTLITGAEDVGGVVVMKTTEQLCLDYITDNSIINPYI